MFVYPEGKNLHRLIVIGPGSARTPSASCGGGHHICLVDMLHMFVVIICSQLVYCIRRVDLRICMFLGSVCLNVDVAYFRSLLCLDYVNCVFIVCVFMLKCLCCVVCIV